MPSSQMLSSCSRSAASIVSSPSVGCSETTAVSIPDAVEEGQPLLRVVIAKIDLVRALGQAQDASVEAGRRRSPGERLDERTRPEVLVDVEARHRQEQILPDRISSTRGSRSGTAAPSARKGTNRRTASRSLAVPVPSRSPRRSQACAANMSSIEATRAPSSTIASSRRAASGAIVIRSSIPSAWVVETSSNETGWARSRASTAIA